MLELSTAIAELFPNEDAFDRIIALDGQIFRQVARRRTLRFEVGGRGYFLKTHGGVGCLEILKNLVSLRLPVLGARDERRAIRKFQELNVSTMTIAGFGERGLLPHQRQSFLITEELGNTVSLEDFCRPWRSSPPPPAMKRALLRKVAEIAATLHRNGVNHRDFYLCHFLLDTTTLVVPYKAAKLEVFVIDLHRVQIRARTPLRWVEKDLAGLYFSAMDIGLNRTDLLRFIKIYSGLPLRRILYEDRRFWATVGCKAQKLYCRHT